MINTTNTEEYQLAPLTRRFWAAVFDYVIYFLFLLLMLFSFGHEKVNESGETVKQLTGVPALLLFASWFAYLPLIEGLTGQTLGKGILGIKVVTDSFKRVTYIDCLKRHLLDVVDFFPFFRYCWACCCIQQ